MFRFLLLLGVCGVHSGLHLYMLHDIWKFSSVDLPGNIVPEPLHRSRQGSVKIKFGVSKAADLGVLTPIFGEGSSC